MLTTKDYVCIIGFVVSYCIQMTTQIIQTYSLIVGVATLQAKHTQTNN